jgi:GxxExxY protein
MNKQILYEDLSYKIRGCFFEVYNTLGPSFKESVYHSALAHEFELGNIRFERNKKIPVFYKKEKVGVYQPDFVVENRIIIEIKAIPKLQRLDELQLYYYLKGTPFKLGFLVNFGGEKVDTHRLIDTKARR